MTFCLRWHSLCSLWIQSAFLYEAVSPVNLFWLEWKAGKAVVVNLFWWNVRRWKAGTKLQIIPSEWVQQMQIHPSAKQIKASKGTYHLRSLWRCINKWQLIIVNAKSLKTQGSYHLQSIWELVSRRGVFENLSSFMWSHFPISSSHLREVSILLLWQTFCKRRPLLFKTPSINWKTESLFNLKKKEIFYGRQFHFAENLQVLISFVQGSLLFHEILHLRERLIGSLAFFILVLIKGGPVKIPRKSTHRCARLTYIT